MARAHPGAKTRGISGTSQFLEGMSAKLRSAYGRAPVPPISPDIPYPNIGVAYSIQEMNARYWIADGRRLIGHKVSLPSQSDNEKADRFEPVMGMIFDDEVHDTGAQLAKSNFLQPRLTLALAFGVSSDMAQVPERPFHHIEWVRPAIEVLDSRIEGWPNTQMDIAADNACAGAVIWGHQAAWTDGAETVTASLSNGDGQSHRAEQSTIFQGLESTMKILAQKMIARGRPLLAGDIVFASAMDQLVVAVGQGQISADFGNLGTVEAQIS